MSLPLECMGQHLRPDDELAHVERIIAALRGALKVPGVQGLPLDVRDNGGGALTEAHEP